MSPEEIKRRIETLKWAIDNNQAHTQQSQAHNRILQKRIETLTRKLYPDWSVDGVGTRGETIC